MNQSSSFMMVKNPTSKNASSHIQLGNPCVGSSNNVMCDASNSQHMSSKKIKPFTLHINPQEDISSCLNNSPLGLKLNKTQDFINSVELKLSKARRTPTKMEAAEKLKASNMSATFIKIGDWQVVARHEGNVVAKCYYAKKKIVWEILQGALKRKIEIHWADIIGINAVLNDNEPGILLVELGNPPSYYRESDPMPRKHTVWRQAPDFTGGQAPLYRRHLIIFPPGALDKHYEKLLQYDKRLFELSKRPFPTENNPYFYSNVYNYTPHPVNFTWNDNRLSFNDDQNYKQTALPFSIVDSSSPTSERNCGLETHQLTTLSIPHVNNSRGQSSTTMGIKGSDNTCQQFYQIEELHRDMVIEDSVIPINETEHNHFGNSQVVGSYEAALLMRLHSLNFIPGLEGENLTSTNNNSIITSQMMIENGYIGYCTRASIEVPQYEYDGI